MTSLTHSHGHAGHGHHHHHHDNTFLLSKNKDDAGVRITRIGLYVNLGMAVGKGVGGYVFNSQGRVYRRNGETPAILTDYSAYCRRHPQLDGSC